MIRLAALVALGWTLAASAAAADCAPVQHRGRAFTVCTADLATQRIDLRLAGEDGTPLGSFVELERQTDAPIAFAMNGGMYHPDRRPVGLHVEDGTQVAGIVTREGPGNFGMLPNGVFCVTGDTARVIESRAFAARNPDCEDATQSGPMLIIDGALHPRFIPDSEFRNLRNGVGATPDGTRVHFAISDEPVTFHEMATLFRDELGVRDALYLDGSVSRLYAPGLDRADPGRQMGPILSITER